MARHFDLMLSIQKPFSVSRPVRCSSSLNWLIVKGRTKFCMYTTLDGGLRDGAIAGLVLGTEPERFSYLFLECRDLDLDELLDELEDEECLFLRFLGVGDLEESSDELKIGYI
ncbi:hypothetical protein E2C01_018269 [Portunus trituberculatus]|uniref:Uncharacterized protein n=1 Tax=Portunus trituberculatus TaxID=210409 RepID=A0A5B7DVN9_PORTR|nr:hypothetical protein [Portunus trituberculatus]